MSTLCPRHPTTPATDLCVECGDYVCGQCAIVLADRRVVCPVCRNLVESELAKAGVVAPATGEAPVVAEPVDAPAAVVAQAPAVEPVLARKVGGKAIASIVLGIFSCTPACLPLPIVGLVLGLSELKAIAAGHASPSGRVPAIIGVGLNGLGGLWQVLVILAAIFGD